MSSRLTLRAGLLALLGLLTTAAAASERLWNVALVGDVMLGTDYPTAQLPAREGRGLLDAAAPYLHEADLALGNLEGTVGTGGTSAKMGCGRCFVFRTPPQIAPRLKEAGFTGWSMANNHAHDFGDAGFAQTQRVLDDLGLIHTGKSGEGFARTLTQGRHACVLAFAPNQGMNDLRDIPAAVTQVRKARAECDLVVVAFHGGAEGSDQSHTPMGAQSYLGENRGDVRAFAHATVDAGADLVFGQGPHVARGMETYRGHLIAYSLGNFMTYGGISIAGNLGWAPLLTVELDAHGRLISGKVVSFVQSRLAPVRLDSEHRAARLIAQRSSEDFGPSLHFEDDGRFTPTQPTD